MFIADIIRPKVVVLGFFLGAVFGACVINNDGDDRCNKDCDEGFISCKGECDDDDNICIGDCEIGFDDCSNAC